MSDGWNRRQCLRAIGTVAGTSALVRAGANRETGGKQSVLAYVGTYSSPQGPEGSKGYGEGIYLFEQNTSTGELAKRDVFRDASNPSWLSLNPAKTHLYAANETADFEGRKSGSVSAFAIERGSGRLKLLNTVSSEGAGPAHLSVHPSGKFVFVANYAGGTVAVLPVKGSGELAKASDVKTDAGQVGHEHAASAPPGSFAISGHDRPHAHMVHSDPSGRFVISTDLALDKIFVWKFDANAGKLSPGPSPSVSVPSGDGPRHFVFHPNGRWFYSLQEEGSTVVFFEYDGAAGKLTARQTVSTLPKGFAGTNFTSEILVTADGKFVYAANRLHDTIAWFAIGASGELKLAGEEWTRGDYPRSFSVDPSGRFLYSCNQRSDAIATFRRDKATGQLTFTGKYTAVGTPAIIVFLT